MLGSGQLGRMLALAARPMGYRIHVLSPGDDTPTGQAADREVVADYLDLDAVREFADRVDVVTFEFENVPAACAEAAAEKAPVRPAHRVLHTTQNRIREKRFLSGAGFPVAPFAEIRSLDDLEAALAPRRDGGIGTPAVLKTAGWGYDGKGQAVIETPDDAEAAWREVATDEAVLEGFIDFEREVSVVGARGMDGAFTHWGVIANDHQNHILDLSVSPAPVPPAVAEEAVALARGILEELDVVGVLCVEMFLTRDGELLVNELAPRPHNSGHLTVDASLTSQFEQQLRTVCGLPLGSTELLRPAAMANLLGDLWHPDGAETVRVPGLGQGPGLPGGQAPPLRQGRAPRRPQDGPPDRARRHPGRGRRASPRRPPGAQQERPLTPSFPLPPRGGRGTPPPTR